MRLSWVFTTGVFTCGNYLVLSLFFAILLGNFEDDDDLPVINVSFPLFFKEPHTPTQQKQKSEEINTFFLFRINLKGVRRNDTFYESTVAYYGNVIFLMMKTRAIV